MPFSAFVIYSSRSPVSLLQMKMSSLVPCFTVSEYSGGPVETGETAGKAERPRYFPRSPRPLSLRSFKLQYSTSFSHVVINCMNILTRRMLYAKRSCSGLETGCSHVSLEHQMVVTVCTAHVMCPKSFLSSAGPFFAQTVDYVTL